MSSLPRETPGADTHAAMKYSEAILECRADIRQYTIWHKSNTEPFLRAAPDRAQMVLDIDVKALSELVHILLRCYAKTEQTAAIPQVFERLRSNIHAVPWQRKSDISNAVPSSHLDRDGRTNWDC